MLSPGVFWQRWGRYWLPVIVWMGIIFFLSSRTKSEMLHLPDGMTDLALKKLAHVIEYAILTLLVWRAISRSLGNRAGSWHTWMTPVLCVVYAFSDEYHQSFVTGRESRLYDVLVDTLGILLALAAMSAVLVWRARHPLLFRVRPQLDRFLSDFSPLRSVAQDNTPK